MEKIPILRMGRFLLVTIQVDMHDRLAMQLQDDLTERIVKDRAHGVLIDITDQPTKFGRWDHLADAVDGVENAVVIRKSAQTEMISAVSRESAAIVRSLPQVARLADGAPRLLPFGSWQVLRTGRWPLP